MCISHSHGPLRIRFLTLTIVVVCAFSDIAMLSIGTQMSFVIFVLLSVRRVSARAFFYAGWLYAFLVWSLVPAFSAINQIESLQYTANFAMKAVFFVALGLSVRNMGDACGILRGMTYGAFILAFRLVATTPLYVWGTARLGESIGLNPNRVGIIMAYGALSALSLAVLHGEKGKLWFLVIFLPVAFLTGSRKAFFAIVCGLGLMQMLVTSDVRTFLKRAIFGAVIALALLYVIMSVPVFYETLGRRLETSGILGSSTRIDASAAVRKIMIDRALELFAKRPLVGYGLNNFKFVSGFDTYSHNNYSELLVSVGLPGTILYYIMPIWMLTFSIASRVKGETRYALVITLTSVVMLMDYALVSYNQIITHVVIVLCYNYYAILKKHSQGIYED